MQDYNRVPSIFLVVLFVFENEMQLSLADENKNLYEALDLVITHTFVVDGSHLMFFANYDDNSSKDLYYANEFINGVLHGINNATYEIFYQRQKLFYNFRHNEIVLLDNLKTFKYFFSQLYNVGNMNLSRTLMFISSLTTLDYDMIYLIFKDLYHMNIIRVALVVELAEDDIVMLTYFPFTPSTCRDFQPVIINRYLVAEQRWENLDYFPNKLNDFYGCPVTCCTWEDMPYFGVVPHKKNSSVTDYEGIEGELLKFVAVKLNFSIRIHWTSAINEDVSNRRSLFGKMFSQGCDFALGGFSYRKGLDYTSTFSQTNNFFLSPIYIVTNVISFYTTYEKLAFPFHYTVWFALGLIFALSSFLIYTCERRRQWLPYRNFLIGSANKTPHYHLYVLAVGANMTMAQMPKRNFARFVLACWLMATLILRSAYQSGMYQMLRDNKQWNPPQTIQNVLKQNYLISVIPEYRKYLEVLPDVKRKLIFNATILEGFSELLNAKKPIAFIAPYEYFSYFGKVNRSQWQHLHLVRERLLMQQLTIYVRHHSYFVPELNDQIADARDYGFIGLWKSQHALPLTTVFKHSPLDGQLNNNKNSNENPLSMNELGSIFMILIWLQILSIAVFLIELMHHRCVNVVKN